MEPKQTKKKEKNFWLNDRDVKKLHDIRLAMAKQGLIVSLSRIVATGIWHLDSLRVKELLNIFEKIEAARR